MSHKTAGWHVFIGMQLRMAGIEGRTMRNPPSQLFRLDANLLPAAANEGRFEL